MPWKTRVTELFGCKYPILQGAFGEFGNWQLAAAVSGAGALGMITAGACRTPKRLREEIERCRDVTDRPFAVNLSLGGEMPIEEMLEVCIEEGVPVETAVYKPDSIAPRIKEAGLKWMHKSARVKDAVHAAGLGVDAVTVVGREGVGSKNPEQLTTMITTIAAVRQLKIPVIAAGGIGDAHSFLGALVMGADGVMMGTAFMATRECPMDDAAKEALVRANPEDPGFSSRVMGSADLEAYDELRRVRDNMPLNEWLGKVHLITERSSVTEGGAASALRQDAAPFGSATEGSLAVGVIDRIPTVRELIDGIIREAEELLDRFQSLRTG